jgi:hypothetical protein
MQMFISCDLGNDYETQSCYAIIRQIAASNRKPRSQLFTSFPRSRPPSDKTAKAKHHLNVSTKQTVMNSLLSRQGQRLLQIGILLIIYSSFDGFIIPYSLRRVLDFRCIRSVCFRVFAPRAGTAVAEA